MKHFLLFATPAIILMMRECGSQYVDNSRIFVEGKIVSSSQNVQNLPVKIVNEDIIVSKTNTDAKGNFKLGGPGTTNSVEVVFNQKIKQFSANKANCKLSYDSLSIYLPVETNYVKFNEIILEP